MDRRRYFSQFLALLSGTVIAQIFNLAAYPLLARLYSPADFGQLGIFIASSAIPGALACGRFELAIATAPKGGRRAVVWLAFSIALAVAAISTLLMALYWWSTASPLFGVIVPLFFLAVLLTGGTNALTMYLMRQESFRFASLGGVVRTAVSVTVQLAIALIWRTPLGLIVGFTTGLVAQAILILGVTRRSHPLGRPRRRHMRAMFRRYRPQVSVDIPGSLLASLSFNLLPFFLQYLYGIRAVGFYSVGQRLAVFPLQLFNDSFAQVYFQRAARAREERGEFWQEFKLSLLWSGLISLAVLLGMLLLAEPVITIYLGSKWRTAGTILVILAPMLAVRSVVMSLASTVFVLQRPAWLLWHNVANLVMMSAAFAIAFAIGAGMLAFLGLLALLQGLEYAAFGIILGIAARRSHLAPALPIRPPRSKVRPR